LVNTYIIENNTCVNLNGAAPAELDDISYSADTEPSEKPKKKVKDSLDNIDARHSNNLHKPYNMRQSQIKRKVVHNEKVRKPIQAKLKKEKFAEIIER